MKESTKQLLKVSLEQNNYDKFKKIVESLEINGENIDEILDFINELIVDKMKNVQIGGNSSDRLLSTFSDYDKTGFLEIVINFREEIANILIKGFGKYIDEDSLEKIEIFKERFM